MNILHIMAGPLIGAVIGYFTNYIAVKMLFRPLHPVKIGSWTLPFTPGIIPRRKPQLARAVGKAVGENLLTQKDLEAMFLSEEMEKTVADEMCRFIYQDGSNGPRTIKNMVKPRMGDKAYAVGREHLEESICDKILSELGKIEIGPIIAEEGGRVVREKVRGTFLEMMISDDMIQSFAAPIGEYMEKYIQDNGHDMLLPMIDEQVQQMEDKPLAEYLDDADLQEEKLRQLVGKIYREIVTGKGGELVKQFHVADIVEEKIAQMDVMDLETLVLSVMEHELNSIVNLGALIGLVIGVVNIFI